MILTISCGSLAADDREVVGARRERAREIMFAAREQCQSRIAVLVYRNQVGTGTDDHDYVITHVTVALHSAWSVVGFAIDF